ncbi:MAG: T9SS type A sorting domain-containing protein [Bacteroidia bacterium]|nr:T9SS type A sorting domain-containing protein [Bacteroidia bacterium]
MKAFLLLPFAFVIQLLPAQHFAEAPQSPPLEGVSSSSVAFADVDGDRDSDLVITGVNTAGAGVAKLYLNDGGGHFTEKMNTPFEGVWPGSIAFADIDGDGDSDLLITGENDSMVYIAKLYTNDGAGNFAEKTDTPLDGVGVSSVAFADVDSDEDRDLFIMGKDSTGLSRSKLYLNDGAGDFTERAGTPFEGADAGSAAFFDADGDGDSDLMIAGRKQPALGQPPLGIATLYLNDGAGNFSEKTGTPFVGVLTAALAISDVDGDGDRDVMITGWNHVLGLTAKLYLNDGAGNFTEDPNTSFEEVEVGSLAFSDVDGDGDSDLLLTGWPIAIDRIAKLYLNDGTGHFTEMSNTPFDGVAFSAVAFADIDQDGDSDLLITGRDNFGGAISKLYLNADASASIGDREGAAAFDFAVYPNPVRSPALHIQFESQAYGEVRIGLYDVQGRLLRQQHAPAAMGSQTCTIDVSRLPQGVYVVWLEDGTRSGHQRVLIR